MAGNMMIMIFAIYVPKNINTTEALQECCLKNENGLYDK